MTDERRRVDLVELIRLGSEFARVWHMQDGCNAQMLDDLAEAFISYVGDNPHLAQQADARQRAARPQVVIIDDEVRE